MSKRFKRDNEGGLNNGYKIYKMIKFGIYIVLPLALIAIYLFMGGTLSDLFS